MNKMRRTWFALIVAMALAVLVFVLRQNASTDDSSGRRRVSMADVRRAFVQESQWPDQIQAFTDNLYEYREETTDHIQIGDDGIQDGAFQFTAYNGTNYIYMGKLVFYGGGKKLADKTVTLLPHQLARSSIDITRQPDQYGFADGIFFGLNYHEPTYSYDAYNSADADGIQYMAYAADTENISEGSFLSLAQYQYGLNVLGEYPDQNIMVFDRQKSQPKDYGDYVEYPREEAVYYAELDINNGEIRAYRRTNDGFEYFTSIPMKTEEQSK